MKPTDFKGSIIVQAGGRGSRLESLTLNKPKALVPIDNLPIIFHLFKLFPHAEYVIIGDYKADVLKKYLQTFAKVSYQFIKVNQKGTLAGIKQALELCKSAPIIISWCDLIYPKEMELPDSSENFVGISKTFECRWSYVDGAFFEKSSKENGVAGFFIFSDKNQLNDVPTEGEFVRWLSNSGLKFKPFSLAGTREIGTLVSYAEVEKEKPKCRPFNKIEFYEDYIIKYPITDQGEKIAIDETRWYEFVSNIGYSDIPYIYSLKPLKMKRIKGKNIYEYKNFVSDQKQILLKKIVQALKNLHRLTKPIEANRSDCQDAYLDKTFQRLEQVRDLVPFADREYIRINGAYYKNVYSLREDLERKTQSFFPDKFYLIHGDPTFSNMMLDEENDQIIFLDPRGYFGKTKLYGDVDYDWAKVYYSIVGNYDQFNRKNFALKIHDNSVELKIESNGWEDTEELFFEETEADKEKIRLVHAIIWLSLTTYAWEDFDSICGAFYKGILELNKVL